MRVSIEERNNGLELEFYPETVEDMTKLLRFANNAKREPADIFLTFGTDKPYMNVYMRKIRPSVQENSINPKRRKR
jgi:hypothetical protein